MYDVSWKSYHIITKIQLFGLSVFVKEIKCAELSLK